MHEHTLCQLSDLLKQKQISSVELCQMYLDRIQKFDGDLNSFITFEPEQVLAQAKQADALRQSGQATRITGIPIAQKDIFCTMNSKTSCASKMLDNFVSPYDATVITKFKQAGAVTLGKTNMDEFAMGSSNENSFYGAVRNPWDRNKVPGGSSGGSAACIAARLAPGATGTDTGGSIRQPAAYCGITGIKPTYGLVSRFGMVAFASSLDQGGPMAQSAEDVALMLHVMAGFDDKDSTSIQQTIPDYQMSLNQPLKKLKVGLPKEYFHQDLNPEVKQLIHQALDNLDIELVDISLPHIHLSIPAYYIIAPAECSSNLARFDGVRYGYRCEDPASLEDLYKRSRSEGLGEEVKRRIMLGTYVLSAGYYDAYYNRAMKIRRLVAEDFKQAFEKVDVIAGPTSPGTAFNIGEKVDDPISMYLADYYTIAINLAGLPAMSLPVGFHDNMPVGMQLIGKHFDEATILNVAHQYQQQTDWHLKMPEGF